MLKKREISPISNNFVCRPQGFTLVEILLAMLITSILILGINTAFRQARAAFDSVEDLAPTYRQARMLTETFRNELSGVYLPPSAQEQAGQQGQNEPETKTSGFYLSTLQDGATEMQFYTLTPSFKGYWGVSHLARVRYRFARDEDTDTFTLTRFEQAYAGEKKIGLEETDVLAKGLKDFKLRIFDRKDREWKSSFNSHESLPEAVRVAFCFEPAKDRPATEFSTSFLIASASSINPLK